jgi:hypothetical protein
MPIIAGILPKGKAQRPLYTLRSLPYEAKMSYPTVFLKPGKERVVSSRHPWIFDGAIDRGRTAIDRGRTAIDAGGSSASAPTTRRRRSPATW